MGVTFRNPCQDLETFCKEALMECEFRGVCGNDLDEFGKRKRTANEYRKGQHFHRF